MDITINGVDYEGVPRIDVPKTDNTGNASFYSTEEFQSKEVTPTNVSQVVTPDTGKPALASVTVGTDKALVAATDANATSTPVVLDFSDIAGLSAFYGWSQFFRNSQEDTSVTSSSFGPPRYCKIKLPSDTTTLQQRLFAGMAGLTEVVADFENPVVAKTRVVYGCPNLATLGNLWAKLKTVTNNSFRVTQAANTVSILERGKDIICPVLEDIVLEDGYNGYAFATCGWRSFTAPLLKTIRGYAFLSCRNMVFADFSAVTMIYQQAFQYCTALTDLYLRTNAVVTLSSVNAFAGSPADTNPTSFTLHVPASLVDDYKNDTNWGALYDDGNGINIVAIS